MFNCCRSNSRPINSWKNFAFFITLNIIHKKQLSNNELLNRIRFEDTALEFVHRFSFTRRFNDRRSLNKSNDQAFKESNDHRITYFHSENGAMYVDQFGFHFTTISHLDTNDDTPMMSEIGSRCTGEIRLENETIVIFISCFKRMVSFRIVMIAENFMFAMVEFNQFVGAKKACSGTKQRLVVVTRI